VVLIAVKMNGSKLKAEIRAGSPERVERQEWQGLVRKLVVRVSRVPVREAAKCERQADDDEVLFDQQVDGVRCVLLRPHPLEAAPVPLSPREQEIARMVAQGYPNKTIASVLEISSWTVASHLRRIFVKLQISSRAAMATCLLSAEFNGLPTLLDGVIDEDMASEPRPSRESGPHPVPAGRSSFANGHARREVSIAKGAVR
jgi:two-component system, NarL family, nitrate/nitrite response regulator NarL